MPSRRNSGSCDLLLRHHIKLSGLEVLRSRIVHKVRELLNNDEDLNPDRDTEVRLTLIQANEGRFCDEMLTRLSLDISAGGMFLNR
jgi:hypothetical protein